MRFACCGGIRVLLWTPRSRRGERPELGGSLRRPLAASLRSGRSGPAARSRRGGGAAAPGLGGATVEGLLRYQAAACGYVGSPLYEDLLGRAADDYEQGGPTRAVLAGHEDDPKDSALALRLMGAVHRLVLEGRAARAGRSATRRGRRPGAHLGGLPGGARRAPADLRPLVERPVQTNEVGRCAALLPGFLEVAGGPGCRCACSRSVPAPDSTCAGASTATRRRASPGAGPARRCGSGSSSAAGRSRPSRRPSPSGPGCEPRPSTPRTEDGRLTLLSYVWPDQAGRMERVRAALELAAAEPVAVERARAVEWIAERLAAPAGGRATVVYHSVVMQYLSEREREEFAAQSSRPAGGRRAEAPLAWLRMEPDGERAAIRLATWPGERSGCSPAPATTAPGGAGGCPSLPPPFLLPGRPVSLRRGAGLPPPRSPPPPPPPPLPPPPPPLDGSLVSRGPCHHSRRSGRG